MDSEKGDIPAVHVEDDRGNAPFVISPAEKKLVRKQDLVITALMSGCFFFAYLDRGAIGNARIMGFQESLGLSNQQYFNVLMMFYVGYMMFEFPAFLLLRRFHAPTVYAISVIIFGVAGLCTAYARNYAQVIILRLILGCGEATVQTSFTFVSLWYRREEMATRCGYVYCTTPVAGAISGLIAYGVTKNLNHAGPGQLASWQWLFIIEGAPTILWGLIVWALLPRLPEKEVEAKRSLFFGTEDEKRMIMDRTVAGQNVAHAKVQLFQIWVALRDPKAWLIAIILGTHAVALAGFGVFLPSFIREFGFSPLRTQLYSIIPYACAFVSLLFTAFTADRYRKRALPLLILTSVAIIGFVIMLATPNAIAGIVGACLISAAVYPGIVVGAAWIPSSNAGYTKRATASWMAQIVIQTFSIMCTQIYKKPPRYFSGHGTLLGLFVLTFFLILTTWALMKHSNKRKDEEARRWDEQGETNPEEMKTLEELCDNHPSYRYIWTCVSVRSNLAQVLDKYVFQGNGTVGMTRRITSVTGAQMKSVADYTTVGNHEV